MPPSVQVKTTSCGRPETHANGSRSARVTLDGEPDAETGLVMRLEDVEAAIADAREGAMVWRDDRDNIAAFNVTHLSGAEGWMGPLAVHPDFRRQLFSTWSRTSSAAP